MFAVYNRLASVHRFLFELSLIISVAVINFPFLILHRSFCPGKDSSIVTWRREIFLFVKAS